MQPKDTVETLRWVVENDFTVPSGMNPFEFALSIRLNLQSPDPELRDKLTYSILCQLLMRNQLSALQIDELLKLSVGDLQYGLGEVGTDSVFARSFSVLIVAAILILDGKNPSLSIAAVEYATNAVIEYAVREQDHRGYVQNKGWAHSVAHAADALGACALHPHVTLDQRLQILEAIRHLTSVEYPLSFEEDDRLAYPVLRMALSDKEILINWEQWIATFEAIHSSHGNDTLRLVNAGHFLRSLYLLLLWEYPNCTFLSALERKVKQLHGLYHYGALPLSRS